jgi:hypothetical protein
MSEEKRGENGQPKPVDKDLASLEAVLSVAEAFGAPNPMKVDSQQHPIDGSHRMKVLNPSMGLRQNHLVLEHQSLCNQRSETVWESM